LIVQLIKKIKNDHNTKSNNYKFAFREVIIILIDKAFCLFRGFFLKFFLSSSKGLIFKSKGAKILNAHKIKVGKNFTLKRNSLIEALSIKGVTIGDNFSLGYNAIIECTGALRSVGDSLFVGNNVGINHYCFIGVRGEVYIGDNVIFGPYVCVLSENHIFKDLNIPIREQGELRYKTVIEDNVWIGAGAKILPGVVIGKGSIIASGAVVTKDVENFSVVGGVPAKFIKKRR
tara:strand:+ start:46 stop:738 length:693 start_codon:yes stop_codon:yes gene_type:complete